MPITTPWTTEVLDEDDITNATIGDGSLILRWRRVNVAVEFGVQFILGSTSVISAPAISLPAAFPGGQGFATFEEFGMIPAGVVPAWGFDASANVHYAATGLVLMTTIPNAEIPSLVSPGELRVHFASGQWGTTNPFTWAEGDYLLAGNALPGFDN